MTGASVFYRITGTTDYIEVAMSNPSGDNYSADIPASVVTTDGVDYYISATDGVNTATHPSTNPETSPHTITVTQLVTETFEDPDTGTTATVQYTGTGTINITSTLSPGTPPSGMHGINVFVEVTVPETMTVEWVYIEVPYSEDDLPSGVDESKLRLFYWTDTGWEKCENTGVDTVNNIVWANITHLTIFAPMAEKTAAPTTPVNWALYGGVVAVIAIVIIAAAAVVVTKKKKGKGETPAETEE
ncbi:MAG: hypothetical protein KJ886_05490 [Candidatus Thermoplasmatota archaeon]|nr:hypothetical protein [Candidatus Thermoplasmatota archaeon]